MSDSINFLYGKPFTIILLIKSKSESILSKFQVHLQTYIVASGIQRCKKEHSVVGCEKFCIFNMFHIRFSVARRALFHIFVVDAQLFGHRSRNCGCVFVRNECL